MIIVLSPAKSLDYDTPPRIKTHTLPDFIARSAELIDVLRKLSPAQIGTLMKISDPLAVLNATRYGDWSTEFTAENSKQAALAFLRLERGQELLQLAFPCLVEVIEGTGGGMVLRLMLEHGNRFPYLTLV